MKQDKIMDALTDIGDDLLLMAHTRRFVNHWRRWLRTAVCLALVICLTALALPYLPIGCGSSSSGNTTETAMPPEAAQDAVVEEAPAEAEEIPETEDAVSEETAPEDTDPAEGEAPKQNDNGTAQALCQLVVRSTIYYLDESVVLPGETPANLGEYIGDVTAADDAALVGCKANAVSYTAWYSSHSVDGQSVPAEIYVNGPDGWVYARTSNEKVLSRYTAEDVTAAKSSGDDLWLLSTFITPLESRNITLADAYTDNSEVLNALFLASLSMNSGTDLSQLWMQEDGSILVCPADIERRLAKFLDDFTYAPAETAAWDAASGMLRFSAEDLYPEAPVLTLEQVSADGNLVSLQVRRSDGSQRLYRLRFDSDSWRYLEVSAVG